MKKDKNIIISIFGIAIGIVNGLLGAGGGIVAVEILKHFGLDQKRAQTTSIAIILPLCVLSAILHMFKNQVDYKTALVLMPSGLIGAYLGTIIMKKTSCDFIKKVFCGFLIYAGVRMIFGG